MDMLCKDAVQMAIDEYIDGLAEPLRALNEKVKSR